MRHIKTMTRERPATAQFSAALQFVNLLSAMIGLVSTALSVLRTASDTFGFEIPQKDTGQG